LRSWLSFTAVRWTIVHRLETKSQNDVRVMPMRKDALPIDDLLRAEEAAIVGRREADVFLEDA
jgi:hypothetical protein